jgi:hypothetical protein
MSTTKFGNERNRFYDLVSEHRDNALGIGTYSQDTLILFLQNSYRNFKRVKADQSDQSFKAKQSGVRTWDNGEANAQEVHRLGLVHLDH